MLNFLTQTWVIWKNLGRNYSILARKSKKSKSISSIKDPSDSDKVTRDPISMANVLNKHFASVGPTLANNLPPTKRHYFYFLKRTKSTDSSFAFNLVTPEEVRLEISCIPKNKSHGLYSYPTRYIKRGCQHPSNKLEILWQVTQNSFSLLLSYFVAKYVLIIVV